MITLRTGAAHSVDPGTMKRVEYARLVRKGEGPRGFAHGAELGAAAPIGATERRNAVRRAP
jgi:hypothetical protein